MDEWIHPQSLASFMSRFHPHPLESLQEALAPYKEMISTGVISATKVTTVCSFLRFYGKS